MSSEPPGGNIGTNKTVGDVTGTPPAGELTLAVEPAPEKVSLLRTEDLVNLTFRFVNLGILGGVNSTLVPVDEKKESFLVVEFPPQSFVEEAFPETDAGALQPDPAMPAEKRRAFAECRMSGPSRLVFRVPQGKTIPYTPAGLLDWGGLELSVNPSAPNDLTTTRIEAPCGLLLSPEKGALWFHLTAPFHANQRTELWHTRLTPAGQSQKAAGEAPAPGVLAIGSVGDGPNFTAPLDQSVRTKLVNQTTTLKLEPARARLLMLSALGAWLNVRGVWPVPAKLPDAGWVESWQHRATLGRDHYVRSATVGYLFPFGHRALKVETTERKFRKFDPKGGPAEKVGAWLAKKVFIVVLEQEKSYGSATPAGRQMPFKRVRIATTTTPRLDLPAPNETAFVVRRNGKPFPFPVVAWDADGQPSEFAAALMFVDAGDKSAVNVLRSKYGASGVTPLPNSGVAYVPSEGGKLGAASYLTSRIRFDAAAEGTGPKFHPVVESATVRVPAVEQVAGTKQPVQISYLESYAQSGFTGNSGQVFARLSEASTGDPLTLKFKGDTSGGLAKPDMKVGGLSRLTGVVCGDADQFAAGSISPGDIFHQAKLLGGLTLSDILPDTLAVGKAPELNTYTVVEKGVAATHTTFNWTLGSSEIKTGGAFQKDEQGGQQTKLTLDTHLVSRAGGDSDFEVTGSLTNFAISLAGIIRIRFEELTFTALKDKKLDFSARLRTPCVAFEGPLAFLNALAALLDKVPDGFKDPPFLDVTDKGVTAGYTLALPPLPIGVANIEGVSFTAGLHLPFSGSEPMRARFAFSERQHPFHVLVYGLGGGGFVGVSVGLDGVETVEAALEFGGSLALNLGVAAGTAYVMAGIYFKVEKPKGQPDAVALTGYLRCGGELEVLGLVSISAEFYMGLTYEATAKKVWGQAVLTVEVEVLFFSESVNIEVRREFTSSKAFTFAEVIPREAWDEYCDAFAA
jgi:hypothetical protein